MIEELAIVAAGLVVGGIVGAVVGKNEADSEPGKTVPEPDHRSEEPR